MIDNDKFNALQGAERTPVRGTTQNLDGMDEGELLRLRGEIDRRLPLQSMSDLNLEHELLAQFRAVKRLQDDVIDDGGTPANQRAQVAGAVASVLQQLIKLQGDLQREETLKVMEACLVEAIKTLPDAVKNDFFAEYERLVEKARSA